MTTAIMLEQATALLAVVRAQETTYYANRLPPQASQPIDRVECGRTASRHYFLGFGNHREMNKANAYGPGVLLFNTVFPQAGTPV